MATHSGNLAWRIHEEYERTQESIVSSSLTESPNIYIYAYILIFPFIYLFGSIGSYLWHTGSSIFIVARGIFKYVTQT